ncbi:MAG: transcriptional repressor [Desulfobacteraceae bacterium]|nr:transcriptional repressor [Desulfobacteraceae bacterium]
MKLENSLRVTRQRRILLEQLKLSDAHPTASEIFDAVRKELPRISLATVYRNLELLAEKGLIQLVGTAESRQKRFDWNPRPHCHAHCVRCGGVADIEPSPEINALLRGSVDSLRDFEVLAARIDFLGYCPQCRATVPRCSE